MSKTELSRAAWCGLAVAVALAGGLLGSASARAEERRQVVGWRLEQVFTGEQLYPVDAKHLVGQGKAKFGPAEANGRAGVFTFQVQCDHAPGSAPGAPHWWNYRAAWNFSRDISILRPGDTFQMHLTCQSALPGGGCTAEHAYNWHISPTYASGGAVVPKPVRDLNPPFGISIFNLTGTSPGQLGNELLGRRTFFHPERDGAKGLASERIDEVTVRGNPSGPIGYVWLMASPSSTVARCNPGVAYLFRPIYEGQAAPGPQPGGNDPLGLAGTWTEHWPGANEHDTFIVGCQNGQYTVQASHPTDGDYDIENVRVEGNALRFVQRTGEGHIQYEVRAQDANTCSARAVGGPNGGAQVVWRR